MLRQLKINQSITTKDSESIGLYFSEVSKIPLLKDNEEQELFEKIAAGDEKALTTVINANLRFVISVAKQYQNKGIKIEDLINDGNEGLIKAAKKFDNSRGFKFISYAVWWIRQSILQSLVDHSRLIRLPNNQVNLISKFNKINAKLEQKYEREPSPQELEDALEELGLDKKIKDTYQLNLKVSSLDTPITDDDNMCLSDVIPNENSLSPDDGFLKESLKKDVLTVLKRLTGKQKDILCMYYGIGEYEAMTLEEIGSKLNLTRERVRQIKDLSIRILKSRNNSKILKQHMH